MKAKDVEQECSAELFLACDWWKAVSSGISYIDLLEAVMYVRGPSIKLLKPRGIAELTATDTGMNLFRPGNLNWTPMIRYSQIHDRNWSNRTFRSH